MRNPYAAGATKEKAKRQKKKKKKKKKKTAGLSSPPPNIVPFLLHQEELKDSQPPNEYILMTVGQLLNSHHVSGMAFHFHIP